MLRVTFRKGKYAGQTFMADESNARPQGPNGPVDTTAGDGIWVEDLQQWFPGAYHWPWKSPTQPSTIIGYNDQIWENHVAPFDKLGEEIVPGDHVYVPMKHEVIRARVLKIGAVVHHGCGWVERKLSLENLDYDPDKYGSRKKFTCDYPSGCIIY